MKGSLLSLALVAVWSAVIASIVSFFTTHNFARHPIPAPWHSRLKVASGVINRHARARHPQAAHPAPRRREV